jgi:hypothetical protein
MSSEMAAGTMISALYCCFVAIWMLVSGVRVWRDPTSFSPAWMRTFPFTDGFRDGFHRGRIAGGAAHAFMAVMMVSGIIVARDDPDISATVKWSSIVSSIGTVVSFLTSAFIVWFNRPRFLVPPHLRGQSGTFIVWWREKRGRSAG